MARRCGETRLVADMPGQWPDGPITTGGTGIFRGGNVMPDPVKQFSDQNGRPYVNGLLWSYRAGTLVELLTYQDHELTTPHENPVTLDLNGRATIYLAQAIYKFVLQTANGVTVWEQDNVPGSIWGGAVVAFSRPVQAPNTTSLAHQLDASVVKASTGAHAWVVNTYVVPPLICPDSARVTVAATMYIPGPPTDGVTNFSLYVTGGENRVRLGGDLHLGAGQTAIGGGATALLGQIGDPNGPDAAAQGGWQRFLRLDGTPAYIPYWTTAGPPTQPTIFSYVQLGVTGGDINLNSTPLGSSFLTLLPGTWTITVSAQATVMVYAVSGGGGGGGDDTGGFAGSSGGGGGSTTSATTVVMLPTKTYTAVIGALGTGTAGVGANGTSTSLNDGTGDVVLLGGGVGGGSGVGGAGGAGGVASVGSNLVNGGAGGARGISGANGSDGGCNANGAGGGGGGSGAGLPGTQHGGNGGGAIGTTGGGGTGGAIGQPGGAAPGTLNPAQGGAATSGFATGGGGGGGAGAHLPVGLDFGGGGGGSGGSGGNGPVPGGNGSPGLMVFTLVSLP